MILRFLPPASEIHCYTDGSRCQDRAAWAFAAYIWLPTVGWCFQGAAAASTKMKLFRKALMMPWMAKQLPWRQLCLGHWRFLLGLRSTCILTVIARALAQMDPGACLQTLAIVRALLLRLPGLCLSCISPWADPFQFVMSSHIRETLTMSLWTMLPRRLLVVGPCFPSVVRLGAID